MAEIELTENRLIIHLKGFMKYIASFNKVPLTIPLAHVVGVAFDPTGTAVWELHNREKKEEKEESPWGFTFVPWLGILTIEYDKEWTTRLPWADSPWHRRLEEKARELERDWNRKSSWTLEGGQPQGMRMLGIDIFYFTSLARM